MIGQNIGKYRVLDRIGRGGMGTVFRAVDETLHRDVAIKVLNTDASDPALAKRFRAEAVTVARLNHPGIATVYELFQHDGQWLMVMEFVRGETLENLVGRQGPLEVSRAADLMMQTLTALAHAHSMGVVHRDLKPANLMVTGSGTVKVMDFGIARVAGAEHLTSAGFMMGTPAYMAPEQVLAGEIDARTDLYATGVVLYHLTTGKLPFKGDTPMEMAQSRIQDEPTPARSARQGLPPWLEQILDISLQRDPAKRFDSALSFRDNLRRGLANLPLEPPQVKAIPPELMATAAPRSMPVIPPPPAPMPTQPPPAEMPTMASSIPTTAVLKERGTNRTLLYAGVAGAALLVLGTGIWFATRPSSEPASTEAPATIVETVPPAPTTPAALATTPAPSPAAPVAAAPPPMPTSTSSVPSSPAASATPAASSAVTPATGAPPPSATGAGTTPAAPGAARSGAVARGRLAGEGALSFPGVRALVVSGKRAVEQDATLRIGDGQVSLVGSQGATLAAIPVRDVTFGTYVRAKDPKWSVVLASPPPDVDLPSGMFSGARHWLTLQSRSSYIIVRLNDGDWRRIADAVIARTGIKIDLPATGR